MSDVSKLVEALEEIVSPLAAMRQRAEANGERLSGMANEIANSPAYLQGIAREALSTITAEGHTEEREKGIREGIEAAAKVAETAGLEHYARQHNGMTRQVSELEAFIARSIRALSPAPQSRGDDDCRADALWNEAVETCARKAEFGPYKSNFPHHEETCVDVAKDIRRLKRAPPTKDSAGDGGGNG